MSRNPYRGARSHRLPQPRGTAKTSQNQPRRSLSEPLRRVATRLNKFLTRIPWPATATAERVTGITRATDRRGLRIGVSDSEKSGGGRAATRAIGQRTGGLTVFRVGATKKPRHIS